MQKWKCVCSFKLLVLGLASFKLRILNNHFGSALQVKHSITRWKLEVGDRILKGILKLQFKSSYAVRIKTGQARSASHYFQNQLFQQLEEMQENHQQQVLPLQQLLLNKLFSCPFSTVKMCPSRLASFMSSAVQGTPSIPVLSPKHFSTGWLAPVIHLSGT